MNGVKVKIMKFLSLLCTLLLMSAVAAAEVSFDAKVKAEAEAENAALAKEAAMTKANREAFLQVAERLTAKDNVEELNKLTDEQLLHFIQEVSVMSEVSSPKAYKADLSIRVNGALLKQYMQENDMLEVVSAPQKILIVPIFSDMEYPGKVLWEDGNVWREAWLKKGLIKSGQFDFEVLADTAPNKKALPQAPETVLSVDDYKQLSAINGIKNIYTVQAVRAGRNNLVLIVREYPSEAEKRFMVTADDGETLDKGIAESVNYITMQMQQQQVAESYKQGQIAATFYYVRLKNWLDMEEKLKSVPQIKSVTTDAIVNGQVKLTLEFSGSESALLNSLENAGIYLQSDNGNYILK